MLHALIFFVKQSQKNAEMWNEMCVGMLPVPTLSRWNRAKGWLDPPRLFTIAAFWQVTSDHLAGVFHYKYQAGCEKWWTPCSHFGIHLRTNQKTFNRVVSCSFVWNLLSDYTDGDRPVQTLSARTRDWQCSVCVCSRPYRLPWGELRDQTICPPQYDVSLW